MDTGFVATQIFAVIVFVFLFFQLYTSYYLFNSHTYSTQKKIKHLLLIWSLPLVGGLLVLNWMLPEEIEIPNFSHLQNSDDQSPNGLLVEKNLHRDHDSQL